MTWNCEIVCVTKDRFQSWRCVGATRDEAERYYNAALTSGASWHHRPVYRVIAIRKVRKVSEGEERVA
jgi:hypothetical protein